MKRQILVAAGGLLLATANTPPTPVASQPEGELTSVVAAPAPSAAEPAKPAKPAHAAPAARAAHGDRTAAADYPRCSATVRDRCAQGRSGAAHPRHREIQLAMRAGERG